MMFHFASDLWKSSQEPAERVKQQAGRLVACSPLRIFAGDHRYRSLRLCSHRSVSHHPVAGQCVLAEVRAGAQLGQYLVIDANLKTISNEL
eukprot:754584-Hanusia_phi.AAC.1